MRTLRLIFALGITLALFVGCSKSDTNTNSTTTTNSTNTKVSSSPASTPASTPATTNSSERADTTAATSSSGEGETFKHQEAGVQFTLPAGWTSKNEDESIVATSPHDAISVVLWVPKGDDFNKAVDDLSEQLDKVIKNGKVTSPGSETTHNGMRAYTAAGTGEVNGQNIAWEVDILQAKKPFFVLTFAAPEMFKMHQGEYQQLLNSIKRTE